MITFRNMSQLEVRGMDRDKILICDDDEELCEFIGSFLKMHNYQAIFTSDPERFIPLFNREAPDLVILDVHMPGLNGLTLCKQIRMHHHIPILLLTGMIQQGDRLRGFEAGADDYITKPFHLTELLARIKANLRWAKQMKATTDPVNKNHQLVFRGLSIDLLTYRVTAYTREAHLLPKEVQLLILLASNPRRLFSQDVLHELLWGEMSTSGLDTVKVHIRNIRRKVDLDPIMPSFIETVRGLGYRFVGQREDAR